ncbi:MAG: phosphotransferase [Anaerolineae bacterium]|nr:phosphotransferase [Anaerolineae bacterium]
MIKPWDQLTQRGKNLRLRRLALQALQEYPLAVTRLRLVGNYTNLVLRADTTSGEAWLVRVGAPGWRTDADIHAEMEWLHALRGSGIGAPQPLAARDGRWMVYASVPGVMPCRVTVQSWLPGTPLERALTADNLWKMGALFARLHAFSATFQPPADFTTRRMQHYLSRGEEHALFNDDNRPRFAPGSLPVFEAVHQRVMAAFNQRYTASACPIVIHNDLWHGNIKVNRGRLLPLDFEDTLWGFPVQDIAMAMQDLMTDVAPGQYEPLLDAFRRGYESILPWPEAYEGEMDLFRAGRVLWVANYVACFEPEYFTIHTEHTRPMLECFLDGGQLRRLPVEGKAAG